MKYPQPPFKKFVKTLNGEVLEVGNKPSFLTTDGKWEIEHEEYTHDRKTLYINYRYDLIVATADTKGELL